MGTRQLSILPYTGKRAYQYYIDGLKVNGKRQRLFFKDEKSAKAKLKELTKKRRKEGEDALALSHDFRVLAAKCAERLKPFGKTLWDATEFYFEHLLRTKDSLLVRTSHHIGRYRVPSRLTYLKLSVSAFLLLSISPVYDEGRSSPRVLNCK